MIQTDEGVKIEFVKLDEWVIQMNVSSKIRGRYRLLVSPVVTIQDLIYEINLLQRSHPVSSKKGGN